MVDKKIQESRVKSLAKILGMSITTGLIIFLIGNSYSCSDLNPKDFTNSTISFTEAKKTCSSMQQDTKVFGFILPIIGFGFWYILDRNIMKLANEIATSLDKQSGKCFNCNKDISNDFDMVLEQNDHIYCKSCDDLLFPEEKSN